MKSQSLSRGPSIDTEICVKNSFENRFNLVLIASARAREIKRQNVGSDKIEHIHSIVTALGEIQEGKIDALTYLKKVR